MSHFVHHEEEKETNDIIKNNNYNNNNDNCNVDTDYLDDESRQARTRTKSMRNIKYKKKICKN